MKKKVALLLALVMVISMLPLSVFGAARPGAVLNPRTLPDGQGRYFTMRVDATVLSNMSSPVHRNAVLDILLSGGDNASTVGFVSTVGISLSAGPDFAVTDAAGVDVTASELYRLNQVVQNQLNRTVTGYHVSDGEGGRPASGTRSYRRIMIDLFDRQGSPENVLPATPTHTFDGFIDIRIAQIWTGSDAANIEIALRTGGEGVAAVNTVLVNDRLVGAWNNGVSITAGATTNMNMFAVVPGITIRENAVGRLVSQDANVSGSFSVRLVAPRGFVWDTDIAYATRQGRQFEVVASDNMFGASVLGTPRIMNNPLTQQSELYITINHSGRRPGFLAGTENAAVTIHGLSLVPRAGAPTSGTLGIDVYVGTVRDATATWGSGHYIPRQLGLPSAVNDALGGRLQQLIDNPGLWPQPPAGNPAVTVPSMWIPGSLWVENDGGQSNWRVQNLTVVNLEQIVGNVTVQGPATIPAAVNSGTVHAANTWLNGNNHTIRLYENVPGVLFQTLDRFEFRSVNPGVRIVDAQARFGRPNRETGWENIGEAGTGVLDIRALSVFENGTLTVAPSPGWDRQGSVVPHRMDVRLALSIEAGYVARFGERIEIEVLRNGVPIGTAHIGNARDLIVVQQDTSIEIYRTAFDVIGPTEASNFSIHESFVGALPNGAILRFGMVPFRDGRPVDLGSAIWDLSPHIGDPVTNEAASGLMITRVAAGVAGAMDEFRVVRPSTGNTPGVISFNDVSISGPVVPGVEWHIVVFGPQIAPNSSFEFYHFVPPAARPQSPAIGSREERGLFYYVPYHASILRVNGTPTVDIGDTPGFQTPPPTPTPPVQTPTPTPSGPSGVLTLQAGMNPMPALDGSIVQYPFIMYQNAITGNNMGMVSARIFGDYIGAQIIPAPGGTGATLVGVNARTGQQTTVVMTVGNNIATINGQSVDIATFVRDNNAQGQWATGPANSVHMVNVGARTFLPVRFLAYAFGLNVSTGGGVVHIHR